MRCKFVDGGRYGGRGETIEEGTIAKFIVKNGEVIVLIFVSDGTIVERRLDQVRWTQGAAFSE